MNFIRQLEGPELHMPSLHDMDDVRQIGLQPLAVQQPMTQWFAMPAPDGTDAFTPFTQSVAPRPQQQMRRFGSNDEGSKS